MKLVSFNEELNGVYHFAKRSFVSTIHLKNRIFHKLFQVNVNKFFSLRICLRKLYIQITDKMESRFLLIIKISIPQDDPTNCSTPENFQLSQKVSFSSEKEK